MTDSIYVLAMIYSRHNFAYWGDHLSIHIRSTMAVPEGIRLTDVRVLDDPHAAQILENLNRLTYKPQLTTSLVEIFRENLVVELSFETPEPLRYTEIPWIDHALTSYTDRPGFQPSGIYCFYLRSEYDIIWFHPLARCVTDQTVIDDADDDDLSYLQRHAEFLDDIFYRDGPSEQFIPTSAVLTLQFGGEVPHRMVDLI